MENPYAEIPGGKRGKRLGNNPYAEVRRPRDSGVRLSSDRTRTPSQQDCKSFLGCIIINYNSIKPFSLTNIMW